MEELSSTPHHPHTTDSHQSPISKLHDNGYLWNFQSTVAVDMTFLSLGKENMSIYTLPCFMKTGYQVYRSINGIKAFLKNKKFWSLILMMPLVQIAY